MSLSLADAKEMIRTKGLRATSARIAVLQLFFKEEKPLSHGNIVELLKHNVGDQATLYRILIKFTEMGLLRVSTTVNGIKRYERIDESTNETRQKHPHFVCNDCSEITCLPITAVIIEKDNPWYHSLKQAEMQFVGICKNCS